MVWIRCLDTLVIKHFLKLPKSVLPIVVFDTVNDVAGGNNLFALLSTNSNLEWDDEEYDASEDEELYQFYQHGSHIATAGDGLYAEDEVEEQGKEHEQGEFRRAEDGAGLLSRVFLAWYFPVLQKSRKGKLDPAYLGKNCLRNRGF